MCTVNLPRQVFSQRVCCMKWQINACILLSIINNHILYNSDDMDDHNYHNPRQTVGNIIFFNNVISGYSYYNL